MIKAQAMVPECEVFYRERGDPPSLHHGVAQVGTKGQVLNLFGSVAKQSLNVTDFKQKSPNQVTNHRMRPTYTANCGTILFQVIWVNCRVNQGCSLEVFAQLGPGFMC